MPIEEKKKKTNTTNRIQTKPGPPLYRLIQTLTLLKYRFSKCPILSCHGLEPSYVNLITFLH